MSEKWEKIFNKTATELFELLDSEEVLTLNFSGEETNFVRLNNGFVRQATNVEQGKITLELVRGKKKASLTSSLSLDFEESLAKLKEDLNSLKKEVVILEDDPYTVTPTNGGQSRTIVTGELPTAEKFISLIKDETDGLDLAGYLSMGTILRGNSNSLGQNHWFETTNFNFDYSLYTAKEKAIKGEYAGNFFDKEDLYASLAESKAALRVMDIEQIELEPGNYRVYLTPSALNEIAGLLGWHALSGGAYKKGECPLADLYEGKKSFSEKISMKENFGLGLSPKFNEWGEVSEEEVVLISKGKLKTLLVSKETEKEFGLTSNKATGFEGPRSLELEEGELKREDILESLKDGIYISNLHYLNWSDKNNGRITGMTRFGCLKVEDGKVVGPIKDLRFDETLYNIFGSECESVTNFSEMIMSNGTYDQRDLGGNKLPGLLLKSFKFTL